MSTKYSILSQEHILKLKSAWSQVAHVGGASCAAELALLEQELEDIANGVRTAEPVLPVVSEE